MNKEDVTKLLEQAKKTYITKKDEKKKEEFRRLANGVFQAEGSITAKVRSIFSITPSFSLNQTLSIESLLFFVELWYALDKNCNLHLVQSSSGNWIIILSSESWEVCTDVLAPYFNLTYGEKYIGFKKLLKIRSLTYKNKTP